MYFDGRCSVWLMGYLSNSGVALEKDNIYMRLVTKDEITMDYSLCDTGIV